MSAETGITVKVAKLGVGVINIDLEKGATLKDASDLIKDAIGESDGEIRVNNEVVAADTELSEGDIITEVPAVKGGSR